MSSTASIVLLRLSLLVVAILCGLYGVDRLRQPYPEAQVQLLDYAGTLVVRAQQAAQEERRLLDEGRTEEVYRPRDERLNAELDWRDGKAELRRALEPAAFARLDGLDFMTEGTALQAALADQRHRMTSSLPATASLTIAGILMLLVLLLRPAAAHSAADAAPA